MEARKSLDLLYAGWGTRRAPGVGPGVRRAENQELECPRPGEDGHPIQEKRAKSCFLLFPPFPFNLGPWWTE